MVPSPIHLPCIAALHYLGGEEHGSHQQLKFRFLLEHVIHSAILQMEALRIGTESPKKIQVLSRYFEILSFLLDSYVEGYNR